MTLDEAKRLHGGQWIYHRNLRQARGKEPYRMRVTSVKTWVRQPDKVEIRARFGMEKSCHTFSHPRDLADWFATSDEAIANSNEVRAKRRYESTAPHARCARESHCIEPVGDEEKCK